MHSGVRKIAGAFRRASCAARQRVCAHLRTDLRLRYPLWCTICLFILLLAPSFSCQDVRFSLRGPVTLGLAGITDSGVDVDLGNDVMTVDRTALRMQKRLARKAVLKLKKRGRRRFKRDANELAHVVFHPLPYLKMIDRIARENGVSPALAAAVIKVESGFKAHAHSRRGARGLMQLLPATARKVGVRENIYQPEHNIRAGVRYLKKMLDRYNGDEKLALAAYNAGPGAVDRYNSIPPYRETKAYVPRVMRFVKEYSKYFLDI